MCTCVINVVFCFVDKNGCFSDNVLFFSSPFTYYYYYDYDGGIFSPIFGRKINILTPWNFNKFLHFYIFGLYLFNWKYIPLLWPKMLTFTHFQNKWFKIVYFRRICFPFKYNKRFKAFLSKCKTAIFINIFRQLVDLDKNWPT